MANSRAAKAKERLKCNAPTSSYKNNKTKMVKACQDGDERIIHFGDPKMRVKSHIKKRKKSYCARSKGMGNLKNKLSANYWARKDWNC